MRLSSLSNNHKQCTSQIFIFLKLLQFINHRLCYGLNPLRRSLNPYNPLLSSTRTGLGTRSYTCGIVFVAPVCYAPSIPCALQKSQKNPCRDASNHFQPSLLVCAFKHLYFAAWPTYSSIASLCHWNTFLLQETQFLKNSLQHKSFIVP